MNDPAEAQSDGVRATRLWERWSNRGPAACPFGVVLRPADDAATARALFDTWAYHPAYLPVGTAIEIARDTPLAEPELFYLGFQRGRARAQQEPVIHRIPLSELTAVTIWGPMPEPRSAAARAVEAAGVVTMRRADRYWMDLTFDGAVRGGVVDLRPTLPLTFCW